MNDGRDFLTIEYRMHAQVHPPLLRLTKEWRERKVQRGLPLTYVRAWHTLHIIYGRVVYYSRMYDQSGDAISILCILSA